MIAPWGNPIKASRFGVEPEGVWAHAVAAGFIASRSGRAIVVPRPFNIVRREMRFLDIYISYLRFKTLCLCVLSSFLNLGLRQSRLRHPMLLELFALNNCLHQS